MKIIFLATLTITLALATTLLHGATIKSIATSGSWTGKGSWDLNRIPANKDTVIINVNHTISVSGTINLNDIVLNVYGTLLINKGDLKLNSKSIINVYLGGNIRGNLSGIIEIGSIKKFDYSNADVAGPAFASSITGSEPNGFQNLAVLPFRFEQFVIEPAGNAVSVNWSTADEVNSSHFEIEKSTDAISWQAVGKVVPHQTLSSSNHYTYSDKAISSGIAYYRIKQVDRNGVIFYSDIKKLSIAGKSETRIYKSGNQSIKVQLTTAATNGLMVRVMSLQGTVVCERQLTGSQSDFDIYVPQINSGVYLVQVVAHSKRVTEKLLF